MATAPFVNPDINSSANDPSQPSYPWSSAQANNDIGMKYDAITTPNHPQDQSLEPPESKNLGEPINSSGYGFLVQPGSLEAYAAAPESVQIGHRKINHINKATFTKFAHGNFC